jgi:flagellar biosynthesis GTPase FlhF
VQAKEQDIASGAAKQREEYQKAFEKQQEEAAKAQEAQQQAVAQEQARIAEERRKAEEAEFARQQERVRQLNTLGSATVKTTDVRTAEGAALVLDLAASAQDPELIEARIQTKLLNQIALGLAGAASNYFNQPVAIVGAARLGGFG